MQWENFVVYYISIISNNCKNSFATNLQKCRSYKQNGYNIEVLLIASSLVQGAASMQLDSSAHRYSTARIFISLLRTQLVDGRWARQMVLCEIDPCFVFFTGSIITRVSSGMWISETRKGCKRNPETDISDGKSPCVHQSLESWWFCLRDLDLPQFALVGVVVAPKSVGPFRAFTFNGDDFILPLLKR
jgi:hypothetical protein